MIIGFVLGIYLITKFNKSILKETKDEPCKLHTWTYTEDGMQCAKCKYKAGT